MLEQLPHIQCSINNMPPFEAFAIPICLSFCLLQSHHEITLESNDTKRDDIQPVHINTKYRTICTLNILFGIYYAGNIGSTLVDSAPIYCVFTLTNLQLTGRASALRHNHPFHPSILSMPHLGPHVFLIYIYMYIHQVRL